MSRPSSTDPVGKAFKDARVRAGYPKRKRLADKLEVDDSTLAIIEGSRPGNASDEMRDYVAAAIGLDWQSIAAQAQQTVTVTVQADGHVETDDARFRRPEGMSDEEWTLRKAQLAGYWDALMNQASTER